MAFDAHDSLWRLSAREIAARVGARQVSARAVAEAALARLEAVNPAINAVVECRPAEVLAQADAVDAALARGDRPGTLCGVPVTIKANVDQRGFATTNGLMLQRDLVAEADSPAVANLRAAGAVLLGRTNLPAFAARWFTSSLVHGRTLNPWDPALTPGGSSGGASAAVAAGIGAIAVGTDIAGSIRYPAYACGVHGLRPTLGRVPAFNASSPERTIGAQLTAVIGPLARGIGDLRLALAAMAGPSPRDPWSVPAPLEGPEVPRRAAICVRPDDLATTPEVAAAVAESARRLAAAGWEVEEVARVPPLREPADLQGRLWVGEATAAGLPAAAEREGDPGALNFLRRVTALLGSSEADIVAKALGRRATLLREWSLFFDRYAVLLLPVSAEPPFPDDLDMQGEAAFARVWEAQMPMIGPPLLGLPGLAVATGLTREGTPIGVQVVAARYREDLCLSAGEAIEAGGVPATPVEPRVRG